MTSYTTNTSTPNYLPLGTSTITIPQGSYTISTESITTDPYYIPSTIKYPFNTNDLFIKEQTTKQEEELSPIEKKIKEQIKINKKEYGFIDIKEYVPNKVYEFTIKQYYITRKIKTICDEKDEFNLETAFFLALAKAMYLDFTPEGHLHKAKELTYSKYYTKIVKHGMKLFKLLKEKEEYDKLQEELRKQQHEKYVAKKKKQKEKKKQRANLELYKVIKDAIEDAR